MRYVFRVWQRDFQVWTKYSLVSLVSNLGEPLLYIVAIGFGLGAYVGEINGMSYLQFLAPAIFSAAVMNAASFETTFSSYTRMAVQKTYDGMIVTPISLREVIAGEIFWGATKSLLTGLSMLLILGLFGLIAHWGWAILVLPLAILTGLCFACIGMVVTSYANSYDFFSYYFTLVLGPMFFFSGTFFPLEQMPLWAQKLAWFLPLTHTVRFSRGLFLGDISWSLLREFLWLLVVTVVLFQLALYRMQRRLRE